MSDEMSKSFLPLKAHLQNTADIKLLLCCLFSFDIMVLRIISKSIYCGEECAGIALPPQNLKWINFVL